MNAVDLFAVAPGHPGRRVKSRGGLSHTPEYRAWQMMRQRCHNPQHAAFASYGGRGIHVCDRWIQSLDAFLADMGPKPSPRHEIDRIDNDRGYEPGNCRWATRSENDRNRRSTQWVTFDGEQRRVIDLCERFGVGVGAVRKRIESGWTAEQAFRTPVRRKAPNGSVALRPRKTVAVRDAVTGQFLRWEAPK